MGWAYGQNQEGREIGYGVNATCDQDKCEKKIDRGLAFVCGGMHDGGDHGCGKYFCSEHLYLAHEDGEQYCYNCIDLLCNPERS